MKNLDTSAGLLQRQKATRMAAAFIALAMMAAIGFSMLSCDDGGGTAAVEKAVYKSVDAEGNTYELTITAQSDKAAYKPKAGDSFKLLITYKDGKKKTSEGTVAGVAKTGDTSTITLSVAEETFTVSINEITEDVSVMTEITGTVPITASDDGDTSPVNLEEALYPQVESGNKAVIGVILDKVAISLEVGDTETLVATVLPTNAVNKAVTWSSSAPAVAAVSQSGEVSALAAGSATITVTTEDGDKAATCTVSVTDAIAPTGLAAYLATLSANSASSPHPIGVRVSSAVDFTTVRNALQGAPNKFVNLDISGSNITAIPDYAFNTGSPNFLGCETLIEITLPDSITSIGDAVFYSCQILSSVTIPNSVTSIGDMAFTYCYNLASVTFQGTIPTSGFDSSAFLYIGDLRAKFYASNASNGTPGTYTTTAPLGENSVWRKQ